MFSLNATTLTITDNSDPYGWSYGTFNNTQSNGGNITLTKVNSSSRYLPNPTFEDPVPFSSESVFLNNSVLLYHFNESSGVIVDYSGNNNNGTTFNGPTYGATGLFGSSLDFDGLDDYVNAGSASTLDDLNPMSICSWIYPNDWGEGNYGRIVDKNRFKFSIFSPGYLRFIRTHSGTNLNIGTDTILSLNSWQHVCMTWDGSTAKTSVKFYVDGTEITSRAYNTAASGSMTSDSNYNLIIGNIESTSRTFNGNIEELIIWNKVINSSEIQEIYDSQVGIYINNQSFDVEDAILILHLNESSGNISDYSGNGNIGVPTGGITYGATGFLGEGIKLDGIDDYVDFNAIGISGSSSRTISGWVKIDNNSNLGGWTTVFGFAGVTSSGTNRFFDIQVPTSAVGSCPARNSLIIHVFGVEYCVYSNPDSDWHHIVATYNGTNIQGYVDGVKTLTQAYSSLNAADNFHIGKREDGSTYFNGSIDEIAVWSRALNDSEVQDLYELQSYSYNQEGSYTSPIIDVNGLANISQFDWSDKVNNATTTLSIEQRTSQDNSFWSDWSSNSTTSIIDLTPRARYLQYRFTFIGGINTPKLDWVTLDYDLCSNLYNSNWYVSGEQICDNKNLDLGLGGVIVNDGGNLSLINNASLDIKKLELNRSGDSVFINSGSNISLETISYPTYSYSNYGYSSTYCDNLNNGSWVLVPENSLIGSSEFCVMKYEAKNVSDFPNSQASGTPWTNVTSQESYNYCRSLGKNYHLISNKERLAIAQDVSFVLDNWDDTILDSNFIYSGHTDNNPSNSLAASTNDSDGYSGTGNVANSSQKRTLKLSTGDILWDFSGNVWEWSSDRTAQTERNYRGKGWYSFNLYDSIKPFGELLSTFEKPEYLWGYEKGMGRYFSGDTVSSESGAYNNLNEAPDSCTGYCGSNYSLKYGGNYSDSNNSGIFSSNLNDGLSKTSSDTGFRCAYVSENSSMVYTKFEKSSLYWGGGNGDDYNSRVKNVQPSCEQGDMLIGYRGATWQTFGLDCNSGQTTMQNQLDLINSSYFDSYPISWETLPSGYGTDTALYYDSFWVRGYNGCSFLSSRGSFSSAEIMCLNMSMV